jgi:hypothetical protein
MKFGMEVNAIQEDLDAIIFNPISSTTLKRLSFKVVSLRHDFQPCIAMVWDCFYIMQQNISAHSRAIYKLPCCS